MKTRLPALLLLVVVFSCKTYPEKFKAHFQSVLQHADMIEFMKGEQSHRFVNIQDLHSIRELLVPVDLKEVSQAADEYSLKVLLYANSEVLGEIKITSGNAPMLYYECQGWKPVESKMDERLMRFIEGIPF